ncbi:hypothetical protein [Nocardia farcinica]
MPWPTIANVDAAVSCSVAHVSRSSRRRADMTSASILLVVYWVNASSVICAERKTSERNTPATTHSTTRKSRLKMVHGRSTPGTSTAPDAQAATTIAVAGSDTRIGRDIATVTTTVPATANMGLALVVNSVPSTISGVHSKYAPATINSHPGFHGRVHRHRAHPNSPAWMSIDARPTPPPTRYTTATAASTTLSVDAAIRSMRAPSTGRVAAASELTRPIIRPPVKAEHLRRTRILRAR